MIWLEFAAPTTLALAFAFAGVNKIRDASGFVIGVLDYEILPPRIAKAFARLLPFVEITVGFGLLVGVAPLLSGLAAALLLASFLVAVSVNLARRRAIACHCFGSQGETIGAVTVARVVLLFGCSLIVLRSQSSLLASPEPVASLLLAVGLLLGLYVFGTVPAVVRILRTTAITAPTRHGGRVSFRNVPLLPISVLIQDRTHETSRCGACP